MAKEVSNYWGGGWVPILSKEEPEGSVLPENYLN